MKESLNFMNINNQELDNLRKSNDEVKKKLEHLERYSGHFILGENEVEGKDCFEIIFNYITRLGFENAPGEVENAHCRGKKCAEKPRDKIAKLYSRPFKRKLLQVAKSEYERRYIRS